MDCMTLCTLTILVTIDQAIIECICVLAEMSILQNFNRLLQYDVVPACLTAVGVPGSTQMRRRDRICGVQAV